MNRNEIEGTVLTVLERVLKCRVNADSSRSNTPQWDSLKHIEVIFELEDRLEMEFSEAEMAEMNSVAAIVERSTTRSAT